jgi:hypothetical protein
MYWLDAPLQLEAGQPVSVVCTVKERLMDFEVSSLGSTRVAGSALAGVFNSLNHVPSAVLGIDTIADQSVVLAPVLPAATDAVNVIWCPEYTVLRCNDASWRSAVLSDLMTCSRLSILCLGDPLALAPMIYRAEGACVVIDCADLEQDSEVTLAALWQESQSLPLHGPQHLQHLCDSPPGTVFDLIYWDPVEPGGLLRSGCFDELIASRTKNSKRACTIAPCFLTLWAQGVSGDFLNNMTEVEGCGACGFDLSHVNNYSVRSCYSYSVVPLTRFRCARCRE